MSHRSKLSACLTTALAITVVLVVMHCEAGNVNRACSNCYSPHVQAPPDLFYNFYVQPAADGTSAQLYLSPVPTPRMVGHTYITYQPLMPHEMMYHHARRYYRYNVSGGFTRTAVRWW